MCRPRRRPCTSVRCGAKPATDVLSSLVSRWLPFGIGDFDATSFIPPRSAIVAGAEILQQPYEPLQLLPPRVRDRAIEEVSRPPERQMVAVAGRVLRQAPLGRGPAEYIDDMR